MDGGESILYFKLCNLTSAEEMTILWEQVKKGIEEGQWWKLLEKIGLVLDLVLKSGMIHLDMKVGV